MHEHHGPKLAKMLTTFIDNHVPAGTTRTAAKAAKPPKAKAHAKALLQAKQAIQEKAAKAGQPRPKKRKAADEDEPVTEQPKKRFKFLPRDAVPHQAVPAARSRKIKSAAGEPQPPCLGSPSA